MVLENIRIILMNTTHPGNIGACARAMKTMGLRKLVLVGPQDFPGHEATARASGADDILSEAFVCDSLDEALAGCHYVLGTSARSRSLPWPIMSAREAGKIVAEKLLGSRIPCNERSGQDNKSAMQVGILFGRERYGLTNEELSRCHSHIQIPTDPQFSSLNLAMAVQVVSYELRVAILDEKIEPVEQPYELADAREVGRFYEHLETVLYDIEFLNPAQPKQLMQRLKRLFARAQLDKNEINIFRGILSSTQKAIIKTIHDKSKDKLT